MLTRTSKYLVVSWDSFLLVVSFIVPQSHSITLQIDRQYSYLFKYTVSTTSSRIVKVKDESMSNQRVTSKVVLCVGYVGGSALPSRSPYSGNHPVSCPPTSHSHLNSHCANREVRGSSVSRFNSCKLQSWH